LEKRRALKLERRLLRMRGYDVAPAPKKKKALKPKAKAKRKAEPAQVKQHSSRTHTFNTMHVVFVAFFFSPCLI